MLLQSTMGARRIFQGCANSGSGEWGRKSPSGVPVGSVPVGMGKGRHLPPLEGTHVEYTDLFNWICFGTLSWGNYYDADTAV